MFPVWISTAHIIAVLLKVGVVFYEQARRS